MRAIVHHRPGRGRGRGGPSVGLAVAALLAAASSAGFATGAADPLPRAELVLNGAFDSYPWIWTCDGDVRRSSIPHDHYVSGYPTADSTARCSQRVRVLPNSGYLLNATVRGPFAFVGVTGAAGENASTWSGQGGWNDLSVGVSTGPETTELTVYFHGWYEQAPYDVRRMSFTGPGYEPRPCGEPGGPAPTVTGGPGSPSPPPSPSPTCWRTYIP
ncbi:hypothetical protein [Kitasatospora purpeofusca]|uniref:Carbohydrate binding protein n=1 Tax=Kitasatospora purpeofusca TaxID=67352 RepID=A0ABZ1TSZ0_9ACTN|nr:hypothetical protein [Kitasatospora purpeofusca]